MSSLEACIDARRNRHICTIVNDNFRIIYLVSPRGTFPRYIVAFYTHRVGQSFDNYLEIVDAKQPLRVARLSDGDEMVALVRVARVSGDDMVVSMWCQRNLVWFKRGER